MDLDSTFWSADQFLKLRGGIVKEVSEMLDGELCGHYVSLTFK